MATIVSRLLGFVRSFSVAGPQRLDPLSVEQLQNLVRRPGDHGPVSAKNHRALHELGMLEEHRHHLFRGLVVFLLEAELLEALVLAHQVGRRIRKQVEEPFQRDLVERVLQVLDDVARDVALAQDLQRAASLPSTRIVVDEEPLHGLGLAGGALPGKHPAWPI